MHNVLPNDRMVSYSDLSRLPYIRATMLEVLRYGSIVPLYCRTSTCDTYIHGHFVPNDTHVGINSRIIHNDPEIWGDPNDFRPERFLDDEMNVINEEKLLAFGGGKRQCLGATMGKVMMFSYLVTLLQKYTFEVSPTHPELNLGPVCGLANQAMPFYCAVKPRSQDNVA